MKQIPPIKRILTDFITIEVLINELNVKKIKY